MGNENENKTPSLCCLLGFAACNSVQGGSLVEMSENFDSRTPSFSGHLAACLLVFTEQNGWNGKRKHKVSDWLKYGTFILLKFTQQVKCPVG